MPRHFTEVEKNEIRHNLLKAARKLFIKFGFSKTTIMDITRESGIGKGSFYQFYNSKGDIFLEIYQIEREKIRRKIISMHGEIRALDSRSYYDSQQQSNSSIDVRAGIS